ncbi:hypothetical protein BSL82_16570 [Tardibacter chloracetimidivorans]|uniref:Uncharacterized protein n=1 Tax=Tardibacter chloracetimidivorans TaxID=1921510 RepID=A0A1L3ZYJ4_9SPHN|nr:hypothetical protein [Tardibacter chloracetimidivorans]API60704.1 hypothetical protein BSL82_16570 [Tardibacter chloracetimidivorans]
MTNPEIHARNRYLVIQIVRMAGIAMVLLGILIWKGDLITPGGDAMIGAPITILGLIDVLIIPQLLARMWRSPRQ